MDFFYNLTPTTQPNLPIMRITLYSLFMNWVHKLGPLPYTYVAHNLTHAAHYLTQKGPR